MVEGYRTETIKLSTQSEPTPTPAARVFTTQDLERLERDVKELWGRVDGMAEPTSGAAAEAVATLDREAKAMGSTLNALRGRVAKLEAVEVAEAVEVDAGADRLGRYVAEVRLLIEDLREFYTQIGTSTNNYDKIDEHGNMVIEQIGRLVDRVVALGDKADK